MVCNKPMRALGVFLLVFLMTGITNAAAAKQTSLDAASTKKPVTSAQTVPVVDYNPESDQLTVNVANIQLRQVLAAIVRKSGIRVMMDPAVKQTVTANFRNQALMKGLKQLLRHTNSAYFFNDKENNKRQLLLAIKILPKGKQSSNNLQPLVGLPSEAIYHARNQGANKQNKYSHATKRWQARMDRMPKRYREKLEKLATERLAKEAKRKEKAAKRREAMKAKREKMKQKRQARQAEIDKELKTNHPDLYEERQRIRAEGRLRAQREQDERGILNFGR